ncbi:hypothetical protein AB0F81_38400 [Actinoplanes sp. NPDC024001]|uniref:hypothetical protein n=1 Tax=Actinoplanes sp. NPDC024001 TaxID=3154598 RepID=UPI00340C82B7
MTAAEQWATLMGAGGDPALARRVRLRTPHDTPHRVRLWRVDTAHGNPARAWTGGDWPTDAQWRQLPTAGRLDEAEPSRLLAPGDDREIDLPNPGIAFVAVDAITDGT